MCACPALAKKSSREPPISAGSASRTGTIGGACGRSSILPALRTHPCLGTSKHPWGRVALPFARELDADAQAKEWSSESLRSDDQRSRATIAEGPRRDGEPVYTHFLGTDAPRSDRWGTPAFVTELLSLLSGWSTHCVETLPAQIPYASPRSCTVQLGDLGWYSDARPDPLGHKTHFDGNCVDVRLFRDDGSRYEAWWNQSDDRPGVTGVQPSAHRGLPAIRDHPPLTDHGLLQRPSRDFGS